MASFRLPDAPPPLKGWTATLYAAIWCMLLAAAIAGPLGTAVILSQRHADALIALGVDWQGIAPVRAGIVSSAEARAQGVHPGDLLGREAAVSVALAPTRLALITGLLTFPGGRFEPRWIWAAVLVTAVAMAMPSGTLPDIGDIILSLFVVGTVVATLVWRFLRDRKADGARQWRWAILGFVGSEKIIEVLGEEYFGESMGALAGGLGAAFAAVAIGPLHHRIAHWVEHRFRRNLIHLRRDLPPLLAELGETAGPEAVARAVVDHLAHGLHATRAAVVTRGQVLATHHVTAGAITDVAATSRPGAVGELEVHRRDPLFPVRLRLAADGGSVLLIGARPDDSLYDRQERDVLAELVLPLAQALRTATDRTAREARTAARFEALERTLAALRADLHPRPTGS